MSTETVEELFLHLKKDHDLYDKPFDFGYGSTSSSSNNKNNQTQQQQPTDQNQQQCNPASTSVQNEMPHLVPSSLGSGI